MKILFVIHSLGSGGAEKIFQLLMNSLDRNKFQVQCILISQVRHNAYVKEDIDLHELHSSGTVKAIRKVRALIKSLEPDLVIGTIAPLNLLLPLVKLSLAKRQCPLFINRESSLMSYVVGKGSFKNVLIKIWVRLFYSQYSRIVCQSGDIGEDLINNFHVDRSRLVLINNPIENTIMPMGRAYRNRVIKLITVARLRPEKGFDRLLDIIKAFKDKGSHAFKYHIVGDFPTVELERSILEKTKRLGVEENVVFHGHMDEPSEVLQGSNVYLQGSFYEGFPNAVLESCAAGVPVVAYDVPGGTKEIITPGQNGYLAEDNNLEDFVSKLTLAINTPWDPIQIAEDVHERFGQEKIVSQYQDLFQEVYSTK